MKGGVGLLITFKYKSITNSGEIISGIYTAQSKSEVVKMIRNRKHIPVTVEKVEYSLRKLNKITLLNPRVTTKDLEIFCKQFYTMIHAGMPLTQCLKTLTAQTENKTLKNIIGEIFLEVQKGRVLSSAMKKYVQIFSPLLIHMVEAGELTGNLEEVLVRMANHFEKENKINSKIKNAMIYPVILTMISTIVIIFILTFIMPSFVDMFVLHGVPLPLPTKILLSSSNTLLRSWKIIFLIVIAIGILFKRILKSSNCKFMLDVIKLRIPIIGNSIIKIVTSRFTRTLSSLLSSGISIIPALEASANVTNNEVISRGIKMVTEDIKKGINLAPLLNKMDIFPPMMISMISIGEESGSLVEMLLKTADFYDQELEESIQHLVSIFEPSMIILMSLGIGFIIIAIMLPMFEIMDVII